MSHTVFHKTTVKTRRRLMSIAVIINMKFVFQFFFLRDVLSFLTIFTAPFLVFSDSYTLSAHNERIEIILCFYSEQLSSLAKSKRFPRSTHTFYISP